MENKKPLVSVMIPNYNHSCYLDECITSVLNQSYENIEIVILDNASEDSSVNAAAKYGSKKVRICRNTFNILNTTYKVLNKITSGKYKMLLCADDYIEKDFIKSAVEVMETHPNVGYVQIERDFITDTGDLIELEPFYNCSFIVSGIDVMSLYMVTTVAHPSQGIFRTEDFNKIGGYDMEVDHMNADRMLWFYLSSVSDCAYIRKKMSKIRIGSQTETFVTQRNFQHPILCHLTIMEMVDFAKKNFITEVYERETEALERLSKEFLNYAAGMLAEKEFVIAGQYLDYAQVVDDKIVCNEVYTILSNMQKRINEVDIEYLKNVTFTSIKKSRNYNPPKNFKVLEEIKNE